jgi:predicted RNase H-like HicB family nuclease
MTSSGSSASSRRSSKGRRRLDRPFPPEVFKKADAIASAYKLLLEPQHGGEFVGRALEFPTVFERGGSAEECVRNTRQALSVAVAAMLELGQRPPMPASEAGRQAQINIRVSLEEKERLAESARQAGFRGVSDFVRAAALTASADAFGALPGKSARTTRAGTRRYSGAR